MVVVIWIKPDGVHDRHELDLVNIQLKMAGLRLEWENQKGKVQIFLTRRRRLSSSATRLAVSALRIADS